MKNIQPYNGVKATIDDYLYKIKPNPVINREREFVIFCSYSSLNDYYIGCGWKFNDKNSCTVYYILNNELCHNFTEQMYKNIQLELELKLKKALVENRKKDLEQDFIKW